MHWQHYHHLHSHHHHATTTSYNDQRNDYVMNEVALDYNSGFQMALAGLLAETTSGHNSHQPINL